MISSILGYVPLSVELLGPMTPPAPSFQTRTHNPQFSNQIDASALRHFLLLLFGDDSKFVLLKLFLFFSQCQSIPTTTNQTYQWALSW